MAKREQRACEEVRAMLLEKKGPKKPETPKKPAGR